MRNLSLLLLAGASLALAACNDQSQQQKSSVPAVQSGTINVTADEIGSEGLKEYVGRYPKSETKLGAMMNFGARLSGDVPLAANSMSKNYYFVLDGSGSMGETECTKPRTKMDVAKDQPVRSDPGCGQRRTVRFRPKGRIRTRGARHGQSGCAQNGRRGGSS
jgi:hypothetical protein